MATLISKKNKSSASTCTTEGSTTSSSPASSVNLITTNSPISQPQHNIVANNNNNAPKYGTLIPNRIFVGGISGSTTETELFELFSAYGTVRAAKVISDRAGVSKGYGFVTFETEDEARRPMRDSECIILKDRKLNIAPAIKKQPFSQTYEAASPPTVHSNTIFYQNGVPYTFHNGVAYFPATPTHHAPTSAITTTGDPAGMYQTTYVPPPATPTHSPGAAAAYPVIYPCAAPPTMYVTPQQFQYQPMPPPVPPSQYIYTASASSTTAAAPGNGPPVTQGSPMLGAPAPLPPAQHYYTQAHLNPTDLYYSIPQPYPTMMSNEGVVYDTSPQTETSSNQSAEDSCSNSSNSDTVRSGGGENCKPPLNQEKTVAKHESNLPSNGGWVPPATTANSQLPTQSQHQNASTPVVSLLKLQQIGEELDICPSKKSLSPAIQDYVTTPPPQQTYYQQVPPPLLNQNKSQSPMMPILYQSVPPMFVNPTAQPSGTSPYMNQFLPSGIVNGHSDHPGTNCTGQFQNHRAPYASKLFNSRRGGGTSGSHSSPMSVHIPPFPPKFHFLSSNHVHMPGMHSPHIQGSGQKRYYNNRNLNQQHRGRDSGRYVGPNSGRMQRRYFSTNVSVFNKNSFPNIVPTSNVSAAAETSVPHASIASAAAITTVATATTSTTIMINTTAATTSIVTSAATITSNAPSPPPAPYSPMTHPAVDSSAPPQQVQFYSGAGNSACHQTYHPTSSGSQQQMAVPSRRFASSSRRSGNSDGGSSGKYSKNVVNSVQVLAAGASKVMGNVDEGAVGGAGDAPTRLPLPNCVVMQEACHQVQALSL